MPATRCRPTSPHARSGIDSAARDPPNPVWIVAPPREGEPAALWEHVAVIERLTDMPSGTVGFRARDAAVRVDNPGVRRAFSFAAMSSRDIRFPSIALILMHHP
jgi:hypothetical protein